jgi:hypothetical protein
MARFGGLGFDVDALNNDAERLFIGFMVGESHRCRIMTTKLSYDLVTFSNSGLLNVFGD